jgi:phosphatidyl-myo-inositol dimannoside synthase
VTRPCLAAITLDTMGGGVAAVSRLLWRVFQDRWAADARLVTLLNDRAPLQSLDSSTATRVRFGAQVATLQISQQVDWVFYTHLSVARVQSFVPPPMRRPYAVFVHGIEAWRPLPPAATAVLQAAALRVANSTFTATRVASMHPSIGPVVPCPLALVPDDSARTAAADARLPDIGRRAVIVVARMSAGERYKGHDELLDAWRHEGRR